ncbi:MAG TPA: phage tail assembly protein [Rhodocyclaceae bacterium]|uniref:phage tail assembly protein n=1 Tax=Plasticicumulans sp. TaxID=2307179 RepID=UPI002C5F43CA|nr:phage tail assembly protein [Rhodocyclaceae bacterium]
MSKTESITLEQPLQRGEQIIDQITIRKPAAGELRGIALVNLIQMDVDALARVLPRITEPTLTEVDVNRMDPADLMQAGSVVAGFLLPASARPASLDA